MSRLHLTEKFWSQQVLLMGIIRLTFGNGIPFDINTIVNV